jgi:hypothetical protein
MKKTTLLLACVIALAIASPASASSTLDGWWPFYESAGLTAHDASGNHNDGTLIGAAQWTAGYFGGGLNFDGSTGRVDVHDAASLEPANAVTVTAYVNASGSPGSFKYIVAKGASSCSAASYGLYTGPSGGLVFYVSQNAGTSFTRSADAGVGVWDGNWHFVVGTYDGANVRLYVDGAPVGSATPLSGPIGYGLPTGNDLFFGHYDGCSGLDFRGSVDEPTVWSRALSPSEVQGTYVVLSGLHRSVSRLSAFPGS